MPKQAAVPGPKETPMERIFFKVVGRKMTVREKAALGQSGNGRGSPRKVARVELYKRPRSN